MTVDEIKLKKCIEDLKKEAEGIVTSSKHFPGIRSLATGMYVDAAHFILEILQNADDAMASEVVFELYSDRLDVTNNGEPFTLEDIDSICSLSRSSKDDPNKIGKFGIGFKSVYRYTDTPKIYSGNVALQIRDLIYPDFTEPRANVGDRTIIEIPFAHHADAYRDIVEKFDTLWSLNVLLFLRSLKQIETIIHEGDEVKRHVLKKECTCDPDFPWVTRVRLEYDSTRNKEYILCNSREILLPVKDPNSDQENERPYSFMIAYRLSKEKIVPISDTDDAENNLYYVAFPTKIRHGFEYLIHAPFETERSRETLYEKSKANSILYKEIPELVIQSLIYLREKKYLTSSFYERVLLSARNIGKEITADSVEDAFIARLNAGERLLPTDTGEYVSKDKLLIFRQNQYQNDRKDVLELFSPLEIAKNIPEYTGVEYWSDTYGSRLLNLLDKVGSKKIDFTTLLPKLTPEWLEEKTTDEIKLLYRIIAPPSRDTGECPNRSPYVGGRNLYYSYSVGPSPLFSYPLIRRPDGIHVNVQSGKFYLNDGSIHQDLTADSYSRQFLQKVLQVPEYDERARKMERFEELCLKYADEPVSVSLSENILDLKELEQLMKELYMDPQRDIESYKLVHAVGDGGEGELSWCTPSTVYLTEQTGGDRDTDLLLAGVNGVNFIDPAYFQENASDEVRSILLKFGVHENLSPSDSGWETDVKPPEPYQWEQKCSHKWIRRENECTLPSEIEYLPGILQTITQEKSIGLYRYIQRHCLGRLQERVWCSDYKRFPKDKTVEKKIFTKIGWTLHKTPWILGKDGEFHAPRSVEVTDLIDEYENISRELLEELGVQGIISAAEERAFDVLSGGDDQKKELLQLINNLSNDDQKEVEKFIKERKNVSRVRDTDAESQNPECSRKQREMNNSPRNAMQAHDISGFSYPDEDDREYELRPTVHNPEKYSRNLEIETREKRKQERKTVRVTSFREDNSEERAFLEMEYKGRCQICGKEIPLKNGSGYVFEAHKLTKDLSLDYRSSRETGWDSLCLCPNCAAELSNCPNNAASAVLKQIDSAGGLLKDESVISILIQVRGVPRTLTYSQRHYLRLAAALKQFDETETNR